MQVELVKATAAQKPVLANLLELYAHDLSEFSDLQLGTDGRFGYELLSLYWQETNRYAFLVKVNGNLAGFVLLKKCSEISGDENVWSVAEFFVVRGYRRHRIGTRVAHELWRKFSGPWKIRVAERNEAAYEFWNHAIVDFTGAAVDSPLSKINGECWYIFSFVI